MFSKLEIFSVKKQLVQFYNSNGKSVIEFRILAQGNASKLQFNKVFELHKRFSFNKRLSIP